MLLHYGASILSTWAREKYTKYPGQFSILYWPLESTEYYKYHVNIKKLYVIITKSYMMAFVSLLC